MKLHFNIKTLFIPLLFVLSNSLDCWTQEINYSEHTLTLESNELKENRVVQLFYPKNTSKDLIALYVLDGNWNYDLVKGTLSHWVRWNLCPDVVIISIDNMGNRTRDLTPSIDNEKYPGSGKASTFLNFVEKELQPKISELFPQIKSNVLFGHSFGGLFALYTLKERPFLFDAYIAVSPSVWWKDQYMYGNYHFNTVKNKPFIYASAGTNDSENTTATKNYITWLSNNYQQHIELYSDTSEGENHFSNVPISLHRSLALLFPKAKWSDLAINKLNNKGLDELKKEVPLLKQSYGLRYIFPEEALLNESIKLFRKGDAQKSRQLLFWLSQQLPNHYQPWYYLGAIHEQEFPNSALGYFQKALHIGGMPDRMRIVIERKIENLNPIKKFELSSEAIETSIAFTPDQKTAFIASHNGKWASKTNPPSKIYKYRYTNGEWEKKGLSPFSNKDEAVGDSDIFISYDGTTAYFVSTRTYKDKTDDNPDIWVSQLENNIWSEPEPVCKINSEGYESSPVTNRSGDLYFSSIRAGGLGMGDFYVAKRKADGTFTKPKLLSGNINSKYGEWNLLIHPETEWIIFESSGRPEGMSPYGDLYISTNDNGIWSKPKHLKELNSTGSDLNIRFLEKSGQLVFISSKALKSTKTDIYTTKLDMLTKYIKQY